MAKSSRTDEFLAKRKKKQTILVGCLTMIALVLIFIAVAHNIKVVEFLDYENKKYGFRMKYPSYWIKLDSPEGGAAVAFVSPRISALDVFSENVNVAVTDLSGTPMRMEQFTTQALEQMVGTFKDTIKILESKKTLLAGKRAYIFRYVGDFDPLQRAEAVQLMNDVGVEEEVDFENPSQFLHIWTVHNNRAYIITYIARKNDYKKYKQELDGMLNSFEFIN